MSGYFFVRGTSGKMNGYMVFALIACLTGCRQSTPLSTQRIELELPAVWSVGASSQAANKEWWRSFRAPEIEQWVQDALSHNHDLQIAAIRLERARTEARMAGFASRPKLDVSVSGEKRQSSFIGLPFGGSGISRYRYESYGTSAGLNWEMDLWGRIRAGRSIARTEAKAAEYELEAARLSIVAQAVRLWVQLAEAQIQERLAGESVLLLEQTLLQVKLRLNAGRGNALNVQQTRANLSEAKSTVVQWRIRSERLARSMELLAGQTPSGVKLATTELSYLPSLLSGVPAGIPAELLTRRADIVAALARIHAANLSIAEADAGLLPRVGLTSSVGTSSDELKGLLNGDSLIWSIGGSLSQTILFPDEQQARLNSRSLKAKEAVLSYRQKIMAALHEVETALNAGSLLSVQRRHNEVAVENAQKVMVLTDQRFELGLVNAATLLDAQRRLLISRSALISVRRAELENRIDLHLALGGEISVEDVP